MKKTYKIPSSLKIFFNFILCFFLISGCSKISGSKIENIFTLMDTTGAVIECPQLLVLEETHPLIRMRPESDPDRGEILFVARFQKVTWDCFGEYDEDSGEYIRSTITITVIVEAEPAFEDYIDDPFTFEYLTKISTTNFIFKCYLSMINYSCIIIFTFIITIKTRHDPGINIFFLKRFRNEAKSSESNTLIYKINILATG